MGTSTSPPGDGTIHLANTFDHSAVLAFRSISRQPLADRHKKRRRATLVADAYSLYTTPFRGCQYPAAGNFEQLPIPPRLAPLHHLARRRQGQPLQRYTDPIRRPGEPPVVPSIPDRRPLRPRRPAGQGLLLRPPCRAVAVPSSIGAWGPGKDWSTASDPSCTRH
jgi:hypothetical protein